MNIGRQNRALWEKWQSKDIERGKQGKQVG
jgi:hypothetical protein